MLSLKIALLLASLSPAAAPPQWLGAQLHAADVPNADFVHRGEGALAADVADLQEQLETGLRARRPQEFEFLARVVHFVEQGHLPLQLVKETFQWARVKRPYPYVFFERALKIRAAKIGVAL